MPPLAAAFVFALFCHAEAAGAGLRGLADAGRRVQGGNEVVCPTAPSNASADAPSEKGAEESGPQSSDVPPWCVNSCAWQGCGGTYKPEKDCQCNYECSEYGNCCWDYDSVCTNPPPPTCEYYGCDGGYRKGNTCQCNRDCEKYNNCCVDYWARCKKDPAPPSVMYESYHGRNAHEGKGATDIDSDSSAPAGLSVQQCEERCTQDRRCSCVTYAPSSGTCWKRANCVESGWEYHNDFDVYLKETETKCLPEHAECGGAGRIDGECCSGHVCQGVIGTKLKYCVPGPGQQQYTKYYDKNCFYPFGGTDIDNSVSAPTGLSPQECVDRCTEDKLCSCVSQERSSGKCWKRANCHPSGWTSLHNEGYNVYMKIPMYPGDPLSQQHAGAEAGAAAATAAPANTSDHVFFP